MERKQNIDEHLKRSLEELEVQPDVRSFHEVLRKMEEKKKRRRFIIFFWFGLLVFCASAISLYSSFFNQKEAFANQLSSNKTSSSIIPKTLTSKESSQKSLKQDTIISANTEKTSTLLVASAVSETNNEIKSNDLKIAYSKVATGKNNSTTINTRTKKINSVSTTKNLMSPIDEKQKTTENVDTQVESFLFLPATASQLPVDTYQEEITFISQDTIQLLSLSIPDSLKDKKKKISFYIGISLDPKLSSCIYLKNNHRNPVYNDGSDFAEQYLQGRKKQNTFGFSYGYGLKAGINIREHYEILCGFGFQRYRQKEALYNYSQPTPIPTSPPSNYSFGDALASSYTINTFNYYYYSAEVNRIYKLSSKVHYKLGLGMQANQLRTSYYVFTSAPNLYYSTSNQYNSITKWTYTANLRSGFMFNAGKRWQFQMSPTFFYSPTSIFKKDYVIKENPYGFSLECLILFRLF
ncbi:MAG: hypothetical protein ABIP51_18195 [Bacteroidia bacterium]